MAQELDMLLAGGTLIDGSGGARHTADVGIRGGRIEAVGNLKGAVARTTVDAAGYVVCPGFIDMHSHSDRTILAFPDAPSRIGQGITTEVVGNCGQSAAPILVEHLDEMLAWNRGARPEMDYTWRTFAQYLSRVEAARPATNLVPLVGHGTVRVCAMGFDRRPPTPRELATMCDLVRQAMQAGAFGLSTGLIYAPGVFARTEEIVALARVAAGLGGIYATHMRDEADGLLAAIDEALEIGRQAEVAVEISHLKAASARMHGRLGEAIERIEADRSLGRPVAADFYPYAASSTSLHACLPPWALEGGIDPLVQRLKSADLRSRMAQDIRQGVRGWPNPVGAGNDGWHQIMIAHVQHPDDRRFQGARVDAIALETGLSEIDTVAGLLERSGGAVKVVRFAMAEADVRFAARTDWIAVGSDGSATSPTIADEELVHPRAYGTAVRFLHDYAAGSVGLEEGIRRMTGLAAHRMGLNGRGRVAPGMAADLVVVDPDALSDRATYDRPHRMAAGIRHVLVNGVATLTDGRMTGRRAGRVLRHH